MIFKIIKDYIEKRKLLKVQRFQDNCSHNYKRCLGEGLTIYYKCEKCGKIKSEIV